MQCPRCQQDNPSHAKFCLECGTPVRRTDASDSPKASYADLERDLTESLDQQTVTREILRAIASSPTEMQPVFDTIADCAMRLCGGNQGLVITFDGELMYMGALVDFDTAGAEAVRQGFPARPDRGSVAGRAVLTKAVVHIPSLFDDPEYTHGGLAQVTGFRSALAAPMLKEGKVIGAVGTTRLVPGPFSDNQVALLKTFADQAVIAIENVRLFTELEARNRELTDALQRETATGEILRLISSSPTDVTSIFEGILRSAVRLAAAEYGGVFILDGEFLHLAASHGATREWHDVVKRVYPLRVGANSFSGRAILERRAIFIEDAQGSPSGGVRDLARTMGYRSLLMVPMLRQDAAIGVLVLVWQEQRAFPSEQLPLLQTFANQAVIAIENVRLFTELQARNRDLTEAHARVTEALEQQTATSEILRVISSSPTDVQPVFDTILRRAVELCGARHGSLFRFDGVLVHAAAHYNVPPASVEIIAREFPSPPSPGKASGRTILSRQVVTIEDVLADEHYESTAPHAGGFRSMLGVPLLRDGSPIGAIVIVRSDPGPFLDKQIALLRTFADQAVIAIENMRLFKELEARNRDLTEALERQTATSDVLQIISSSPTNIQPVFDTIVRRAVTLCDASFGGLHLFDGEQITLDAHSGLPEEELEVLRTVFPLPIRSNSLVGRAIRERFPVQVKDVRSIPGYHSPAIQSLARYRTGLAVPMLRGGAPIGALALWHSEVRPFTDRQIELVVTFASQAVIAIENVRLFTELEGRNRDLTATSEILRVISSSPTDVQPVFDTIVRSAVRLCNGLFSGLFQFDGELLHFVAQHNFTAEALEEAHRVFPVRPTRAMGVGRVILERAMIHMPDVEADPEYQNLAMSRAVGVRSLLCVPMLREGAPIGVIAVARAEPGPFSNNEIELLKTFADQAVIAVENVRLFKELEARTGELTQSVEKLTALGEVSHALSSTLDVETVLDTIVSRATQLAGADGCAISEYDDASELFHVRATHGIDASLIGTLRAIPLRKGEGAMGRAAETREPTQIADIAVPGAYQSPLRDVLIGAGFRAVLSVPLLREEQIIGSLSLTRKLPGEFPLEVIEVLKTFATQSALAIQNARLFREIADKSRQLEAASRHKSEFLANMSHELRTPLNAIIGFSEILAEKMFGDINEKQTEYLQDILESGRHLLSLINDILDLSKIEAGRMELEATDFDLPSAIDNALILVRERATRRGITLGHTIDERLGMLHGDERKVKQVLLNLLSNALKFTPEGGRIDVSARLQDGAAEIAVTDTGVGIAPEDQEAVFEEFQQVGTADKKVEGTGLGLALSRKFIELHGGRIWVKSQVGQGSTFTFTLPMS